MKKIILGMLLLSLSFAQQESTLYKSKNGEISIKQDSFVNALGRDGLEFNAITVIYKDNDKTEQEVTKEHMRLLVIMFKVNQRNIC